MSDASARNVGNVASTRIGEILCFVASAATLTSSAVRASAILVTCSPRATSFAATARLTIVASDSPATDGIAIGPEPLARRWRSFAIRTSSGPCFAIASLTVG